MVSVSGLRAESELVHISEIIAREHPLLLTLFATEERMIEYGISKKVRPGDPGPIPPKEDAVG